MQAESTGGQISSRLLSMRSANALLELPAVRLPRTHPQVMHALHVLLKHSCCTRSHSMKIYASLCQSCYCCLNELQHHSILRQAVWVQADMTLPAGTMVSALLISDLQAMPQKENLPMLQPA